MDSTPNKLFATWAQKYEKLTSVHGLRYSMLHTAIDFYMHYNKFIPIGEMNSSVINTINSMFDTFSQWNNTISFLKSWYTDRCFECIKKCNVFMNPNYFRNVEYDIPTKYEIKKSLVHELSKSSDEFAKGVYIICTELENKNVQISTSLYIRMLQNVYAQNNDFKCSNELCSYDFIPRLTRMFNTTEKTTLMISPTKIFEFDGLLKHDTDSIENGWDNKVCLYHAYRKSNRYLMREVIRGSIIYMTVNSSNNQITDICHYMVA